MITPIYPDWNAPKNVHALTSTRLGGVSLPPYHSLNLGTHVGDKLEHVLLNRTRIIQAKHIPAQPQWLNQTHSNNVVNLSHNEIIQSNQKIIHADGAYTQQTKQVCVVLTADCLPVLFCSKNGDEVAAAHAGWRGLCHGILENTVQHFQCDPNDILAWFGPAIGPDRFEVGQEVKDQFEAQHSDAASAFTLIDPINKKYLANIYQLAQQRLNRLGITKISGGEYCTYRQSDLFYSYRREKQTGRMASIIWFE